MTERSDLIETLDRHHAFLLQTADGLTEEQARAKSTVSALTIASLLKHVAETEDGWIDFAERGREAFEQDAVYDSDVDWSAVDEAAQENGGEWGGTEWEDPRFTLTDEDTLPALRARMEQVQARTRKALEELDLDTSHPLPEAPWFEQGASWSVRRVAVHILAEVSQHAGHADIIREAIDGQRTMG